MLIFDAQALRRADRIDTVVLDSSALLTGDLVVEEVTPVDDTTPTPYPLKEVYELINLDRPDERQESGGWAIEPVSTPSAAVNMAASARRGCGTCS